MEKKSDTLEIYMITDVGKHRNINQDNCLCNYEYKKDIDEQVYQYEGHEMSTPLVLAVADGVGGLNYGEVASFNVVNYIAHYFDYIIHNNKPLNVIDLVGQLNALLCKKSQEMQSKMGSTLAMVCISDDRLMAINIGDSRIYFYRKGSLTQLSVDHTESEMLKKIYASMHIDKKISEEKKHVLTQHLGIDTSEFIIEPEIKEMSHFQKGDVLLLCSDGLTDTVSNEEINAILSTDQDIKFKGNALLERAIETGSSDNITIVLCLLQ